MFFFFKQKTAYEMRISDWSSDVCSSDLQTRVAGNSKIGVEGMATMFLNSNRNKRSIVLDIKSEAGLNATREIAAQCDVIVQNFRPGVTERLGIDYESISKLSQDIIYVSVDGLGSEGRGAQRRVYDIVIQGLAGFAGMQAPLGGGDRKSTRLNSSH